MESCDRVAKSRLCDGNAETLLLGWLRTGIALLISLHFLWLDDQLIPLLLTSDFVCPGILSLVEILCGTNIMGPRERNKTKPQTISDDGAMYLPWFLEPGMWPCLSVGPRVLSLLYDGLVQPWAVVSKLTGDLNARGKRGVGVSFEECFIAEFLQG